jgi:prepilin-type N-terminal cleavage/methylation domain-containing protein
MLMTNSEIMNAHRSSRRASGFNLTELLIVIGVIAFLATMVIPALYSASTSHGKRGRILCVANLKEIGTALRREGGDNSMQVVLTNSESMKQVTNGSAYLLWQCLSNSLNSPNTLHCYDDRRRKAAQSFSQGFSNTNISYFFNLDAPTTYPQLILAGDRNVSVDGLAAKPGLLTVSTNTVFAWTRTDLHRGGGNLLLTDGSCQQVTSDGLNRAFAYAFGASTNIVSAHLVIP